MLRILIYKKPTKQKECYEKISFIPCDIQNLVTG